PIGAGRQALEYLAKSVALYDVMFLAHGGFQKGGTGAEDLLQPWAATFTSLPAVRFDTDSSDDNVVVRSGEAEGALWYYAVNASGVEKKVDISFDSGGSLQTLGMNPQTTSIEAGQTITVTVQPYDLQAWKLN